MESEVRRMKQISTHSAREDGDFFLGITFEVVLISTHSAREDGDVSSGHTLL